MLATADIALSLETGSVRSLPPSATVKPRFTLDGSEELERHLDRTCQSVLAGVQSIVPERKLEALLLGGGYGRGEGGVLKTETGEGIRKRDLSAGDKEVERRSPAPPLPGERAGVRAILHPSVLTVDKPYNDLEFYVFLRGNTLLNERRYRAALHDLAERLTPGAGVEVEFKILSLPKLRRSPATMFYYDLMMGHRWLRGEESLLASCEPHREAKNIPLSEATRLLMNRCTGLLFARERLQRAPFTAQDADFVGRNLAKAQLAFGDSVLTAFGQYHWSCRERNRRLNRLVADEDLPWLPEVQRQHGEAVEFKLHPRRGTASSTELQKQHAKLTALGLQLWLWLEWRRLKRSFASARDYALCPINKCPEANAWRNRLVNVKTFGPSAFFAPRASRYPRERLLHTLALLLWEAATFETPGARPSWAQQLRALWNAANSSRTCLAANAMRPGRPRSGLLKFVQGELRTTARTFSDLIAAYAALWRRFN